MSGVPHGTKIGLLRRSMAMRGVKEAQEELEAAEVEYELEKEQDTIAAGMALSYYLSNSWRYIHKSNGGQGRGASARLQRQARRNQNIRARSSKRA